MTDNRTCPECGWAKSEYRRACESCMDKHSERINREKEESRQSTSESCYTAPQDDIKPDFCTYNGQHD